MLDLLLGRNSRFKFLDKRVGGFMLRMLEKYGKIVGGSRQAFEAIYTDT